MPSLITNSNPGELFVLRNAGNLIPPFGFPEGGGCAATIEYAVSVLKIKAIVVCGHSQCGAMEALLHPEQVQSLPAIAKWLQGLSPPRSENESVE